MTLSKLWSPIGELRSYGPKKILLDSKAVCHYCRNVNSLGDSISGPTPPLWGRFFMLATIHSSHNGVLRLSDILP